MVNKPGPNNRSCDGPPFVYTVKPLVWGVVLRAGWRSEAEGESRAALLPCGYGDLGRAFSWDVSWVRDAKNDL